MSAYTAALRRYQQALASSQAAPGTLAAAELDEARRELDKFAIDPEYDPSRKQVAA